MKRHSAKFCFLLLWLFLPAGDAPAREPASFPGQASSRFQASSAAAQALASESRPEMDLAAYVAELNRLSSEAAGLDKHPDRIQPLRESLPKSWIIRAGGQRFESPTAWLGSALDAMNANPATRAEKARDIEKRLDLLRQQAEEFARADAGPSPADARAHLESILRRREFRQVQAPSWWDDLMERFWALVRRILARIFGGLAGHPRMGDVLVWVTIALAFCALVFFLARTLLHSSPVRGLEVFGAGPPGKGWHDWAHEALEAAARNDYRAAVHAAYWAGVYRLADLGTWQVMRSRTPREYVRLLAQATAGHPAPVSMASQSPLAVSPEPHPGAPAADSAQRFAALKDLTERLELAWYGYQPVTMGDFGKTIANLEALGCRFPSNVQTANS